MRSSFARTLRRDVEPPDDRRCKKTLNGEFETREAGEEPEEAGAIRRPARELE
ncbi:hypothetical protein FHS96_003450 [Sphingomonas zeicaulis]|uniref:hypothetical protein n=1 Tax=Sphingomonas zeicaulis TaxID=1632740 RepID=UPI003D1A74AF